MITLADILTTTIVPFTAAVLFAWLMSQWRNAQPLAVAIAVACGFWAGKFATDLRDAWGTRGAQLSAAERIVAAAKLAVLQQVQPAEAHDWLPLLGLVSAVVFGLAIAKSKQSWFLLGGLAMAVLVPLRMLWSSVYFVRDWSVVEMCLRVAGIVACLAVPVFVLPRWPARGNPRYVLMPALVALGLLAAGVMFLLTGSKTYGELGSVLSFAFLGAWCGGLLCGTPLGYNDLPVVSMLLGGMAILAVAYSATPMWQVLVLGAGMSLASLVLRTSDKPPRLLRILAVCIVIASTLTVVGVAAWRFARATSVENPYSQYMK